MRAAEVIPQPGQFFGDEPRDAGVFQPDGVDHSAGGLRHSVRWVPGSRLDAHRLGDDASDLVERNQVGVLLPVAAGPRGEQDGALELDAENHLTHVGEAGAETHWGPQSRSSAENTGPSMHAFTQRPSAPLTTQP